MPEELKPPQTISEIGIHLVYMSKAIISVQQTLHEMQSDSVGRIDFDEHVVWGKDIVKEHDIRITKLEEIHKLENSSTMHRVLKGLDAKIVGLIITLMFGSFLYGTYMMVRYTYLKNLPVELVNK